jgi:acetyl esterase/lipase
MWKLKKFIWCYLLLKLPPFLLFLILPHNIRAKNVKSIHNIGYGDDRFQRYDLHIPMENNERAPILFYIHGGSWMSLDKRQYRHIAKAIAMHGYRVVNINYRLMPKVTLANVVEDTEKAIFHALDYLKPTQDTPLFIMGDSAGAHLAALIAAKANCADKYAGIKFSGAGLFYGLYDLCDLKGCALLNFLKEYLERESEGNQNYLAELSPLSYSNADFPPSYITGGERDALFYGTRSFARIMENAGVKSKSLFIGKDRMDGLHGFLSLTFLASSKQALKEMLSFFEELRTEKAK